ncbi:uncharacterized mitochondrial protein-like protein [Tanacetum coccineum]
MSDNDTIDAYAAKFSGIASKSATLGEVMSEHKLVKKFLTSLPRWFVHIVASLEQVLDLKTIGFEDVVGRLKAYEERVKEEEDKANDAQENLLYARTKYSNGNNDSTEGRGRGSYSRDNEQMGKQHEKRNLSHIQCYRCDQYGHFVSKFLERNRNHEVNLNETQEKGAYHEEDEEANSVSVHSPVHETSPKSEEDNSGSDDTSNLRTRFVFTAIQRDQPKSEEDNSGSDDTSNLTLKEMGFLQCVHEKAMYRKVPNGEFIIVAVNVDNLFVTGTSLDLINEFKKIMLSQFEISDLSELAYYLGIEVSQEKDYVEIKQERYAMKILKEAGMEDCKPALCLMEPGLKLLKAKDKPEVEATQYRKVVGCLCYLLHTRPDLTYAVGVVFGIEYKRGNDMRLVGYNSHNVDSDDGRSINGHVFLVHHPLHGAHIRKLLWRYLRVKLSSCQPLQLRVKQFG